MLWKRSDWAQRVGTVFRSKPRIAGAKDTVWLDRKDIEGLFERQLQPPGINVCLDGPTGTGKSSLALTTLHRLGLDYIQVQITHKMDWKGFCRRIIETPRNRESAISAEIIASLEGLLPKGSIKVSLGSKGKPSDQYDLWDKVLSKCDEADICHAISSRNGVLLIDDFEKACEDLVTRVADMCKLLTQSFESDIGKLVIVGTGDIFTKLYSCDPSLEERLKQFSLGTLPSPEWSWKYLQLGFEALGLYHPANSRYSTPKENRTCMLEVYKASDGLFKGLTFLGREICLGLNPESKGVKARTIIKESQKFPPANYKQFRRKFPEIFRCSEGNPVVRAVLRNLYDNGIGQIHDWNTIFFDLEEKHSSAQVDNAIAELVQVGFLVRTGKEGEVLFVAEPVLAHTLGVVVSFPEKFSLPERFVGAFGQYKLPFLSKDSVPNNSKGADELK